MHATLSLRGRIVDLALIFGVVFGASLFGILTRPVGYLAAFWATNALLMGVMVRWPRLSTPWGWLAAAAGYLMAEGVTGGECTWWLTTSNLMCAGAGVALFRLVTPEDRKLRRPLSVLFLFVICLLAALASALVGSTIGAVFLGKTWFAHFGFWVSTEWVNSVILVPVLLTAPAWRKLPEELIEGNAAAQSARSKLAALGALFAALL